MRFKYSVADSTQNEFDSLPRLPLTLHYDSQQVAVTGLVDSGATVNVLPYEIGLQLGATWNEEQATLRLAGNLGTLPAHPLVVMAAIGPFPLTRLVFAWSRHDQVPVILGQTNFFMAFEVCFFRNRLEFEIKPHQG